MPQSSRVRLATLSILIPLLVQPCLASVHFTSQSNTGFLSFTRPDFSDARLDAAITLSSTADAAGDSTTIGWAPYQNTPINRHVTTTGGVTIENIQAGTTYFYTVRHLTGTPGTHTYSYTRLAPDSALFMTSTIGGISLLHFQSNASALAYPPNPYTWSITINGDWSSQGHDPFQSELLSLNPGWTITQNFIFDGTNTTLGLSRTSGDNIPAVAFNLYLPAPGSAAFAAMGMAAFLWRRR